MYKRQGLDSAERDGFATSFNKFSFSSPGNAIPNPPKVRWVDRVFELDVELRFLILGGGGKGSEVKVVSSMRSSFEGWCLSIVGTDELSLGNSVRLQLLLRLLFMAMLLSLRGSLVSSS